jgi:prolyl 4-hydroxylase
MTIRDELGRVAAAQGQQAAIAMLEHRAASEDPEALQILGEWRLWGLYGPRDLEAGYGLISRAAELGNAGAAMVRASLLATGTGTERDPAQARAIVEAVAGRVPAAARQLELLDGIDRPVPPAETIRADPLVARVDGLLSAGECAYLIALAGPRLQPSFVADPVSGRRIPHPGRTSDGASLTPYDEDLAIHAINCRIAEASGTRVEQGEPLNVLRYSPGQEYRPHIDGLAGVGNPRSLTVLVYLNDDFDEGETDFPKLGVRLRGAAGDAILFSNVDAAGRPDLRTEHAGRPVTRGAKWLATRWIRQRDFHPWKPETV